MTEVLDEALSERDTADWLAHFAGVVPAAPINDVAQALKSVRHRERTAANSRACQWQHLSYGEYANWNRRLTPPANPAPALGRDTDALLEEIGLTAEQCARLRDAGII